MTKPVRMILDVDTGIDDALAIFYALKRPGIKLEAITTVSGNVHVDLATRNTLQLLELTGRTDVPVAAGAGRSLVWPYTHKATSVHGENGLGDITLPEPTIKPIAEHGVDLLIRMARENPGEITLVPVGPLTNIALAFLQAPDIAPLFKEIVIMGGAVLYPGNVNAAAEYNIWQDPEAARIVFQSGARVKLVGLDVTMQTLFTGAMIEQIAAEGPADSKRLMDASRFYLGFYQTMYPGIAGCALHDPLAVAVAEDPTLVRTEAMLLDVVCDSGETRGQTYADRRIVGGLKPNVDVCLEVDVERFTKLFIEALAGNCAG